MVGEAPAQHLRLAGPASRDQAAALVGQAERDGGGFGQHQPIVVDRRDLLEGANRNSASICTGVLRQLLPTHVVPSTAQRQAMSFLFAFIAKSPTCCDARCDVKSNMPAYLQSWSLELEARASRVRQLIGDAHWLSDGHHKEELLRDFLARYLPRELSTSRGFVKSTISLDACSPEVDILIADASRNPPLFSEGGLQIVDTSAVLAFLEVKTRYSKPKLKEALLSTARTSRLVGEHEPAGSAYSLIHFYTGEQGAESPLNTLEDSLRDVAQVVVFLASKDDGIVDCRLFEAKGLSLACAVGDLLGHVRRVRGGPSLGGMDNLVESMQFADPVRREFKV